MDYVSISPEVFVLLIGHVVTYPARAVHGVLIGEKKSNKVFVTDAFPICHEHLTRPLVETALELVQSNIENQKKKSILGWYTAPELFNDTKPSPVVLRTVASLATSLSLDAVLIVVDNQSVMKLIKDGTSMSNAFLAYRNNGSSLYVDPMSNETNAIKNAATVLTKKIKIIDLVDHWDGGVLSDWITASNLASIMRNR